MPDLSTLANYAEIIGAAAVLFAVVFGVLELHQHRNQRRENASLTMVQVWQNAEYVQAILQVLKLEDHIEPEALERLGPEFEKMAFTVCMTFEGLGVMANRGTLPLEVVNDLMGGAVCTSWRKLDAWVMFMRSTYNPRAFEWHEWLADQLDHTHDARVTPS